MSELGFLREFKVYDKTRSSGDWMSLVGAAQCAVFFKDRRTGAPLSRDGVAFDRPKDCTFLVFDRLEDARRYCEAQSREHPWMCCEVFNCEGRAKPPLLVVVAPSVVEKGELSGAWGRRRTFIAAILFVSAIPLFLWDWKADGSLILPTVLGINMIVAGLRLLYWNTARSERTREQARRCEDHVRCEGSAQKTKDV